MEPPLTCRYCLEPAGQADNPLLQPCACRGSQAAVHRKCLLTWIFRDIHHIQRACEVCHAPYAHGLLPSLETPPTLHIGTFLLRNSMLIWLLSHYAVAYLKSIGYPTAWVDLAIVHSVYGILAILFTSIRNPRTYLALYARTGFLVPLIHIALLVHFLWTKDATMSYIVNFWLSGYWLAHEKVLHEVNQRLIGML